MSLGDHLDELRRRLILAVAPPLPLFILIFLAFSDPLIEWLLLPVYRVLDANGLDTRIQVLSPPEFLLTKLKLSLIAAIIFTAPWIFYQLWLFIAPGLYKHERRFVRFLIPGSAILTLTGVALMYYIMLPVMLHMLVLFASKIEVKMEGPVHPPAVVTALAESEEIPNRANAPSPLMPGDVWLQVPGNQLQVAWMNEDEESGAVEVYTVRKMQSGHLDQAFRASSAINFALLLIMAMVIAFQMPLVILLLGWMGLVEVSWLAQYRRHAVMVLAVVSAAITPADAVSMIMMLVPLYGLYELGIILLRLVPAQKVADGSVFRFSWPSGWKKPAAKMKQPVQPSQPDATVARSAPPAEFNPPPADKGGDD